MITIEDDAEFYGLKVTKGKTLEATATREEASPFFLGPSDNIHKDEFYIVYYAQRLNETKGHLVVPNTEIRIPYYLEANPNIFGGNSGPLQFKPNVGADDSSYKFKFEVPMTDENSTKLILKGKSLFYISCQRKWKMSSYIFLKRSQRPSDDWEFQSGCTHSKARHDQKEHFMLFRLQELKPTDRNFVRSAANLEEVPTNT